MTTLHFIRHGETDWNRLGRLQGSQDIPLNEEGRRQARRLAEAWDRGGDVLVASPQVRARETAEILAQAAGLSLKAVDPLLVERAFGEAEGLTLAERQARYPDGRVPGVEPHETVLDRARGFLDRIVRDHPGRRIVAVSHGGFINTVLAMVSGGELGTGKSLLANASVTTLVGGRDGWVVAEVGTALDAGALGLKE